MSPLVQVGLSNCVMALLLAALAACAGRCWRRPAVTHGLWLLVLLKLITPPLIVVPVAWAHREVITAPPAPVRPAPEPLLGPLPFAQAMENKAGAEQTRPGPVPAAEEGLPAAAPPVPPLPKEPVQPAPALPPPAPVVDGAGAAGGLPWSVPVGVLWLGGAVCWFVLAGQRVGGFNRLLRHATAATAELQNEAEALAARLRIRRCPRVLLVPGAVSPMLWALGRAPLLLVPSSLLERLTGEQRATLLVHELAHLRRRDHWVRVLELVVLGLYWWFPLVWWARRELREAEEECCDAWVVWALPDSPRAYATALVETLDFLSGATPILPPVASGIGPLPLLRRRLTMIMRGTTPRTLTGAGFLGLVGLGVVLLPLLPSWAQPPAGGGGNPGAGSAAPAQERLHQLDKARGDVKRLAESLEQMRHEIEKQKAELDRRSKQLHEAMEQLRRTEEEATRANTFKKFGGPGGMAGGPGMVPGMMGPGGRPFGAPLDKRLGELERKLDLVLQEVQKLRQDIGKQRPRPGFPGGPGGGPGGAPGAGPRPPGNPNLPTPPGGPPGGEGRPGARP